MGNYTYGYEVLARPGLHYRLSATVESSPNGWGWRVLRDGTVLEHGHKGARDDAMSDATWYINQVLRAQGAQEVIFKPDHWTRKVQLRPVSLAKLRWGEPGRSQPGGKR